MAKHDAQPQEQSTARGNFLTVAINLATGQSRALDDAETARAAAEAARRQADKNGGVLMLGSSAA